MFDLEVLRAPLRRLYTLLFAAAPTRDAIRFFRDMGWIGFSFGISRVLAGVVTLVAARMMGPEQFGNVNLALGAAALLGIGMLFGLSVPIVRYGAAAADPAPAVGTGLLLSVGFTTVVALFSVVFSGSVARLLQVQNDVYWYGLGLAVLMTLYTVITSSQQAARRFSQRGAAELLFAVILIVGYAVSYTLFGHTYLSLLIAYVVAYFVSCVIWVGEPIRSISSGLKDSALTREMISYGFYGMVCGVGFFLTSNYQRFVLNDVLSVREVGIYGAYSFGTIGMAYYAGSMVSTVFLPKASASTNRERLFNIMMRTWTWLWLPMTGIFLVGQWVFLVIIGRQKYPVDPQLLLYFSACATVIVILSCMASIISAQGLKGARLGVINSLLTGGSNIILSWLLIPTMQLRGAALAMTISHLITMVWVIVVRKWYF